MTDTLIGVEQAARDLLERKEADPQTVGYREDLWLCLAEALKATHLIGLSQGEGEARVARDCANSHCFDHQVLVGDELIAFANDPWANRIAAALSGLSLPVPQGEVVCPDCGGNGYSGGKMPADPEMRGEYDVACEACCGRGKVAAERTGLSLPGRDADGLTASVAEVMAEGDGHWSACTGCQESNEGHVSTRDYPYSETFKCQPGGGCGECGGIGVTWTPSGFYDGIGEFFQAQECTRENVRAILWKHLGGDDRYGAIRGAVEEIAALSLPADGWQTDREDAERWRALLSSDRLRMMGCAGIDFSDEGFASVRDPVNGNVHLGLEIWDKHPAGGDKDDTRGRKILLAYVDHLRAKSTPEQGK